jgi:hypothetical protein
MSTINLSFEIRCSIYLVHLLVGLIFYYIFRRAKKNKKLLQSNCSYYDLLLSTPLL